MNTQTLNTAGLAATKTSQQRFRSFAPWLSRFVMFPPVIIFSIISIRFLGSPALATPGVSLNTPEAFTDTRVMGAWILTLLAMLITFLFSKERLWLGHLQLAAFMGITLVVRIYGFMNDGTTLAMGHQRPITIVEVIFLALNTVGLIVQTRLSKQLEVRR